MTLGRPSKYDPAFIHKAQDYLDDCQDTEDEFHKTRGEKSDSYDRIVEVNLPTIEGFALYLGVNKTTLYEWEKIHPDFSNALDKIRIEQHKRLVNHGLAGDYNPVITKLILMNNHGMKERSDLTSDDKQLYDKEHKEKADNAITRFLQGRTRNSGADSK